MPTFRVQKDKENPYVMINKKYLSDPDLSMKAKGILTYLLSKPDDWKVYQKEIVKNTKEGRDAIRSGIKELEEAGYIIKVRLHKANGEFAGYEYFVYEIPQKKANGEILDRIVKSPKTDFPKTDKPKTENPQLLINELKLINDFKEEEEGENPQFENLEKIAALFKQVFNQEMQPFHLSLLKQFNFKSEIIQKALRDSGTHNAQSFQYTLKLLKNWSNKGIDTLDEIERLQSRFKRSDDESTMEDLYEQGYR